MNNLKKKQKIVIAIILGIIFIGIYYYINTKDSELLNIQEENLEIQENEEDNKKEVKNEKKIKIHISGAVNQEGIIELETDSRIADAIEKAGGVKENACMDEINLAYPLEDGMKVYIPTIEEQNKKELEQESPVEVQEQYITKSSGISIKSESVEKQSSKININTATQTELETLPGIGPSTALKIIQYRNEKGKFSTIEGIKEVSGIGENKFNQIKDLISV